MSEPPNLDPAAIERLLRLGGREFVVKMIDLFFSYATEKIAEAQKAQAGSDWAALAKAVHPIKSSAGNVGASRVQGLAQRIESLARAAQAGELGGLVDQLTRSLDAAKLELEVKRKSLVSSPV